MGPWGVLLLLLTVGGLVGLPLWQRSAGGPSAGSSTLERIQRTGVVRIGYANEAPYGYLDSRTGRITGEAPEIARVILGRLGARQIEPVVTEFGSLIPGLQAGRFDVIAAGMYITPPRAEEIRFSRPTYAIGQALLVEAGNPLALHRFEDLAAHDSARLGVLGGSVEYGYARDLGVPERRTVVFPDYPSGLEGLRTGRVDAIAATSLTAHDLLDKARDPRIALAEPFYDPVIGGRSVRGYGAFGFRREDADLVAAFDRELERFLGSPEHLELVGRFGFGEHTLPGGVTAEEVLAMQQ